MIIWINGAFGVGKTQTAYELLARIPHAQIFDPEEVGFFIQKQVAAEFRKSDFQDYPAWRLATAALLKDVYRAHANPAQQIVIVPMTVVSVAYFEQILSPLKEAGIPVKSYTLMAQKSTIEQRLIARGDGQAWNFEQVERCLNGLQDPVFQPYVDTDKLDLYQVVEWLGQDLGLSLKPVSQTPFARWLRRLKIVLKHIRLF